MYELEQITYCSLKLHKKKEKNVKRESSQFQNNFFFFRVSSDIFFKSSTVSELSVMCTLYLFYEDIFRDIE